MSHKNLYKNEKNVFCAFCSAVARSTGAADNCSAMAAATSESKSFVVLMKWLFLVISSRGSIGQTRHSR